MNSRRCCVALASILAWNCSGTTPDADTGVQLTDGSDIVEAHGDGSATLDATRDEGLDVSGPDVPQCMVTPPTACPAPAVRYDTIAPIVESRCVPCHDGRPGGPWSLRDYEHVADWQFEIRDQLRNCTMPPADSGVPMTDDERLAIMLWVRCGALP